MGYKIREIKKEELEDTMILIWETFLKYDAPFFEAKGIETFKKYFNYNSMTKKFQNPNWKIIGVFDNDKIIGTLVGKSNYLELFFVDEKYQKKGIGKMLFKYYVRDKKEDIILYSSHIAVSFYEKLGFIKTENEKLEEGMLITPMIYKINTIK